MAKRAANLAVQAAVDGNDLTSDVRCLVRSKEGNGISDELAAVCDGHITIPMVEGAESFNASVAAAILMWELVRGNDNV